ncbi:MAG: NAD(P)H-hydrate dehydratase [Lautropia sp.]
MAAAAHEGLTPVAPAASPGALRFACARATIRRVEAAMLRVEPEGELMRRAADAVAAEAGRMLRAMPPCSPVVLLVGPGNNGGDALFAGLALAARGHRVDAFAAAPRAGAGAGAGVAVAPAPDTDAARAARAWSPRPLHRLDALLAEPRWLDAAPLIVDGLFGIGLARALDPGFGDVFDAVARASRRDGAAWRARRADDPAPAPRAHVLAIDVPSGLDADTGMPAGGGPVLDADATVTMIADKIGLRTGSGPARAGRIVVATLSRDGHAVDATSPADVDAAADAVLLDAASVVPLLPRRSVDAHKGRHGHVLVVGGRLGMAGAARLAARGALAAGAGKVTIGPSTASPDRPVDPARPELMQAGLPTHHALPARFDVVLIGCGLGTDAIARALLRRALDVPGPLVVDADALGLLGGDPALARRAAQRSVPAILTPHPLEAARLLGIDTDAVQRDRVAATRRIAARYRAIVVLKGAGSVVADPSGHAAINTSGGPILATGGTGDVLGGIIAALAAVANPASAACAGTWLHGAAADVLAARNGPIGTPAASIAEALPSLLGELLGR